MAEPNNQEELERLRARVAELEKERSAKPASGFSGGFFGCFGVAAAVVVAIVALASIGKCSHDSEAPSTGASSTTLPANSSSTNTPSSQTETGNNLTKIDEVNASSWTYNEYTDALHDKKTKTACTTSINEVNLDFPYHNVTANLCIRKGPKYGLDAYVTLNGDGQILCDLESCTVQVRFDKEPVRIFSGAESADHSSNIIFIENTARLVASLKKSNTTVVELKLYQAGNQDVTFNTKGLVWP